MARGAPPFSQVKLRVVEGDVPTFGSLLVMRTGRAYQVIGVRGRGLTCIVLPAEGLPVLVAEAIHDGTPVLPWQWAKRERKAA